MPTGLNFFTEIAVIFRMGKGNSHVDWKMTPQAITRNENSISPKRITDSGCRASNNLIYIHQVSGNNHAHHVAVQLCSALEAPITNCIINKTRVRIYTARSEREGLFSRFFSPECCCIDVRGEGSGVASLEIIILFPSVALFWSHLITKCSQEITPTLCAGNRKSMGVRDQMTSAFPKQQRTSCMLVNNRSRSASLKSKLISLCLPFIGTSTPTLLFYGPGKDFPAAFSWLKVFLTNKKQQEINHCSILAGKKLVKCTRILIIPRSNIFFFILCFKQSQPF